MNHRVTNRILPHADTAVLFVHGILGTPDHFDAFLPLIPDTFSVCNLLLKGHGGTVQDFSKAKMAEWKKQVDQKVEQLSATHRSIIIVAHSMGTLFALRQATLKPTIIKNLFLLAVPLKISPKPSMVVNALKVSFDKIKPTDKMGLATKKAYSLQPDRKLWRYIGWIPRYLELFREIRSVRKIIKDINVPCEVFQSSNDEIVSLRTNQTLTSNTNVKLHSLNKSSHYYYDPDDLNFLLNQFIVMLNNMENK